MTTSTRRSQLRILALIVAVLTLLLVAGVAGATWANAHGHTPVTICHQGHTITQPSSQPAATTTPSATPSTQSGTSTTTSGAGSTTEVLDVADGVETRVLAETGLDWWPSAGIAVALILVGVQAVRLARLGRGGRR